MCGREVVEELESACSRELRMSEPGVLLYVRCVSSFESASEVKPCSLAVGDCLAVVEHKEETGWCVNPKSRCT